MTHKVFISYSRKDKEVAQYICEILEKNGIEFWIDKKASTVVPTTKNSLLMQ